MCFGGHHRWGVERIVAAVVGGVVIACVFGLAFGWLVMVLWNWLMPALFGLKTLTYWQAFGIIILSRLIMGGFGCHHRPYGKHFRHHHADEWSPGGDRRNWRYYRQYWNERGKKDFEEYLKQSGLNAGQNENSRNSSQKEV
jgi:hypothetical protein